MLGDGLGRTLREVDEQLPTLAEDAPQRERLARFEREAKLLASLNHPSIAAIHGIEEFEGQPFLLELALGEDLSERLNTGREQPRQVGGPRSPRWRLDYLRCLAINSRTAGTSSRGTPTSA